MIYTVILGKDKFIGQYYLILEIENTQYMWWEPALPDSQLTGPFWIYDMENSEHHHDVFTVNIKPHKLKKMSLLAASIVQEW